MPKPVADSNGDGHRHADQRGQFMDDIFGDFVEEIVEETAEEIVEEAVEGVIDGLFG
ncbi:hypothetical protein [Streptomyces sp. CO7]